jgi:hypothetical protein
MRIRTYAFGPQCSERVVRINRTLKQHYRCQGTQQGYKVRVTYTGILM